MARTKSNKLEIGTKRYGYDKIACCVCGKEAYYLTVVRLLDSVYVVCSHECHQLLELTPNISSPVDYEMVLLSSIA